MVNNKSKESTAVMLWIFFLLLCKRKKRRCLRFIGYKRNSTHIYDATGAKLKKIATEGSSVTTTVYAGNYVYKNGSLEFFNHAEGYVEPVIASGSDAISSFEYIYQYKDHLGNIRLSYSDKDNDGKVDVLRNATDVDGDNDYAHEILEENNYYPFGMKHQGYNNLITSTNPALKFKYNGIELEESLGLNLYEMELRQYDPAIARWTSIDPVTHYSMSTYTAFDNNPIYWADPSGANSTREWMEENGITSDNLINIYQAPSDDNTDPKKKKTKSKSSSESSTGRRGARQRRNNRGRIGSGSLLFDARGQELLSHWLDGSGTNLDLSSKNWQDYMKSHKDLKIQILFELGGVVDKNSNLLKKNGSFDFDLTFHGEIDNGYLTGYEMLHGTHSGLGDLQVKGTIYYDSDNDQYSYFFTAIWNDKIDPNKTYEEDTLLSNFLNIFYSPKDYNVKIKWQDSGKF